MVTIAHYAARSIWVTPLAWLLSSVWGPLVLARPMSDTERAVILDGAIKAFDRGIALQSQDSAAAASAFKEAIDAYQVVIDSGVHNGKLFYNLGNAYLHAGHLGQAIASYRRAERLIPGDGNLAENLGYARSLCRTQIPLEGGRAALATIFFWHGQTSQRARFLLGMAAYFAFWVVVLCRLVRPRFPWLYSAIPLLCVWLTLGASVIVGEIQVRTRAEAVLVADEVVIRKGNGESYDPQFKEAVHAGVELVIIEDRDDWLRVRLRDGQEGWVPRDTITLVD